MTMYNSKLAVAVKHNGKVLREEGENVMMPFGEEYSIFIKNLNTKRAIVKISIDGTDISKGGIVVNANSSVDIERFVTNNDEGNRFKFIERTAGVENSRGVGVEDGLIRVEYQFEKERPIVRWGPEYDGYKISPDYWNDGGPAVDPHQWKPTITSTNPSRGILRGSSFNSESSIAPSEVTLQGINYSTDTNDAGITVPGSISNQSFVEVEDFPLENKKHVIVLKLIGVQNDEPVKVVTPSRQKPKCVTCERVNKASAKFCSECGTSLIVI